MSRSIYIYKTRPTMLKNIAIQRFVRTEIAAAAFAVLSCSATTSFAQQQLERVEVTGSSIRRVDSETASPVQVISRQDLVQSGKGTVAEYLQTLTADSQGSVPFTYGRGFSQGSSSGISLRGLGANATLVLINGRRVTTAVLADDAQRSYVDLNQIPFEAVERIEVLKDGASSIYGSDAIAGVVNIILRKNFVGTAAKINVGTSAYGDGEEKRFAITHGIGELSANGYNLLLNVEGGQKDPIYYRDRVGRGSVGVSTPGAREWGFDPNTSSNNIARVGGNGWIPVDASGNRVPNGVSPSLLGNVRNPIAGSPGFNNYYSRGDLSGVGFTRVFANAQQYCLQNANLPQSNPAGGCITDQRQAVNQIQPEHQTGSFYGRLTRKVSEDLEVFSELGYYQSKSHVDGLAPNPGGAYFTSDGVSHSQAADTVLGASHPDNPYFGTAARLSYLPLYDTGIASQDSSSKTWRAVAGARGLVAGWEFDAAVQFSDARQRDTLNKVIDYRVKNALLNPTAANVAAATAHSAAYAALPAGTVWRIGENAGLNSAAMYNALLTSKSREGFSRQYGADLRLTRDLWQMDGGAAAVAVGVDARHEENELPLYEGLGNYIGQALTAYKGKRDIAAAFGEIVLPVLKSLELSGALRFDHYSDAGNATTPKVGFKWKAADSVAVRGTFARGFRAPSAAENGADSLAAFAGSTINDNARCAALKRDGIADAVALPVCRNVSPAFVQRGNPNLEPERSKSFTFGVVWDVNKTLSVNADLWVIKRTGLPVLETAQTAIDAGRLARDDASKLSPSDPGGILNAFVVFQNASSGETRGVDVEIKHRWSVGEGLGRINSSLTWTRLQRQRIIDAEGLVHDYAGTHGDCGVTNCIGSPRDRVSAAVTWDLGSWRMGANMNFRGVLENKFEKSDTSCAQHLASGEDAPNGCKVASFFTLDLSAAFKLGRHWELSASLANALNRKPATDFLTYGAVGFYPLDYSGAVGRYYKASARYLF